MRKTWWLYVCRLPMWFRVWVLELLCKFYNKISKRGSLHSQLCVVADALGLAGRRWILVEKECFFLCICVFEYCLANKICILILDEKVCFFSLHVYMYVYVYVYMCILKQTFSCWNLIIWLLPPKLQRRGLVF